MNTVELRSNITSTISTRLYTVLRLNETEKNIYNTLNSCCPYQLSRFVDGQLPAIELGVVQALMDDEGSLQWLHQEGRQVGHREDFGAG